MLNSSGILYYLNISQFLYGVDYNVELVLEDVNVIEQDNSISNIEMGRFNNGHILIPWVMYEDKEYHTINYYLFLEQLSIINFSVEKYKGSEILLCNSLDIIRKLTTH